MDLTLLSDSMIRTYKEAFTKWVIQSATQNTFALPSQARGWHGSPLLSFHYDWFSDVLRKLLGVHCSQMFYRHSQDDLKMISRCSQDVLRCSQMFSNVLRYFLDVLRCSHDITNSNEDLPHWLAPSFMHTMRNICWEERMQGLKLEACYRSQKSFGLLLNTLFKHDEAQLTIWRLDKLPCKCQRQYTEEFFFLFERDLAL